MHAALLAGAARWMVVAGEREPAIVHASGSNEAALLEEPSEPLVRFEPPPLVPQPPDERDPPDPVAQDEAEPLPEERPLPEPPRPLDLEPRARLTLRVAPSPPPEPPPAEPVAAPVPEVVSSHPVDQAEVEVTRTPVYPRRAVELGLEGTVVLLALVRADGTVGACEVESGSGHEMLDRAAREALLQWRFRPRVAGGIPRPFTARVPFEFFVPRERR